MEVFQFQSFHKPNSVNFQEYKQICYHRYSSVTSNKTQNRAAEQTIVSSIYHDFDLVMKYLLLKAKRQRISDALWTFPYKK